MHEQLSNDLSLFYTYYRNFINTFNRLHGIKIVLYSLNLRLELLNYVNNIGKVL